MFLPLTCYTVWLFSLVYQLVFVMMIQITALLRSDKSHIKFSFISMLHHTWNLRYYRYIRIITCVGLEPFLLAINLNVVSSSNVLSSLIYVFKINEISFFIVKKQKRDTFEIYIYIS